MALQPGTRFDRYRIEAKLGEGGMGCVYRAYDERLQRSVALKVVQLGASPFDATTSRGAAQLLREARAAAALDHPNAIAIFDVGAGGAKDGEAALPYIAMELIEGRSLRTFVGRPEPDLEERIRWLVDVARAVNAAHRRGLVHRDIKPENVMVRREDGVVKVLDFGIARRHAIDGNAATRTEPTPGTLTGEGSIVGTPFYMAPEQMRGEPVDGRADQFAWGVLAYELLSGRLPWGSENQPLVIVSNLLTQDPPPLRTIAPDVPEQVAVAVTRALSKRAADRFASMDEIVRQLDPRLPRPSTIPPSNPSEEFVSAPTLRSTKTSLATSARETPSPPARAPRGRRWVAAVGITVAIAIGSAALGTRGRLRPLASHSDASAPGAAATTLLDLPLPNTNAEALAAYKDAMERLHRGDFATVIERFKRAVDLDPSLGPALLRLARATLFNQSSQAHDYFRRAKQLRSSLSARDQFLLDAFAPLFDHEPADLVESRKRLASLTARLVGDAEVELELASLDARLGSFDSAVDEFDRAIALDANYGHALYGKARALLSEGDLADAIAVTHVYDSVAPGVASGQGLRVFIEELDGQCEDLEGDAREMILNDPNAATGYTLSAEALADTGSAAGSVREALFQAKSRMTDSQKVSQETVLSEVNLPLLDGNFDEARRVLALREAAVADSAQELDHATVAWARIQVALETGDEDAATAIAEDFRTRSRVWSLPPYAKDWIRKDARIPILAVLLRKNRIREEELAKARAAATATMADPRALRLWLGAYAWPATTPAEAQASLDLLSRFEPIPKFLEDMGDDFLVGRVYYLAGRSDEGLPHLARAAKICDMLLKPFEHIQANLLLGQALESTHDVPGACKAYRTVLSRWGNAKPRSRTADAARARANALSCP